MLFAGGTKGIALDLETLSLQGGRRGRRRLASGRSDRPQCQEPRDRAHAGRAAVRPVPDGARRALRRSAPDLRRRRDRAERQGQRRHATPASPSCSAKGQTWTVGGTAQDRSARVLIQGALTWTRRIRVFTQPGGVDNFTHSLAGWALGQTGLKRKTRKGLAALILGANMPDIDVFFGWVPWAPLATHRGWTHSLVGGVAADAAAACGAAVAARPLAGARGQHFAQRPGDAFRLAGRAELHRCADASAARLADTATRSSCSRRSTGAGTTTIRCSSSTCGSGAGWRGGSGSRGGGSGAGRTGAGRRSRRCGALLAYVAAQWRLTERAYAVAWSNRAGTWRPRRDWSCRHRRSLFWHRDLVWRRPSSDLAGVVRRRCKASERITRTAGPVADGMTRSARQAARADRADWPLTCRWSILPMARLLQRRVRDAGEFSGRALRRRCSAPTACAQRHVARRRAWGC